MKVLMCAWRDLAHPEAGGAEVWTDGLCAAWADAGHDVTLFAAAAGGARIEDVPGGYRIVRAGGRLGVFPAAAAHYETELRHGRRYDLVIDQVNTLPFLAHRWARGADVITFAHQIAGNIWDLHAPRGIGVFGRRVVEPAVWNLLADTPVVTAADSVADSLRTFGVRDVRVVSQAAELPALTHPVPKSAHPRFVFCGRLVASKRPLDAVAAFVGAREHLGSAAELVIIGDGPERPRLERFSHLGVNCVGRVDDTERNSLMASSWALLATSVREGWGLGVSEAAAVGTTTVAYSVDGLIDSVRATGGVLVAEHPSAMAAVLRSAVDLRDTAPASTGVVAHATLAAEMLTHATPVPQQRRALVPATLAATANLFR